MKNQKLPKGWMPVKIPGFTRDRIFMGYAIPNELKPQPLRDAESTRASSAMSKLFDMLEAGDIASMTFKSGVHIFASKKPQP